MKNRYSCRPAGLLTGLALMLLSLPVIAADPVAKIIVARGGVAIERPGAGAPLVARTGTILEAGDIVNTGPRGRAVVLMNDETAVQLNRNTRFQLKEVARTAGWFGSGRFLRAAKRAVASAYELTRGQAFVRNKNRQLALTLGTPVVTLGIRGTEFTVTVAADGATTVDVLEGSVAADNSFGNLVADSGERIITAPGAAPRKAALIDPEDAVQWTVIIPPLLSDAAFPDLTGASASAQRAATLIADGRLGDAATAIDTGLAADPADGTLQLLNAYLALETGEAGAARTRLTALTAAEPGNAAAWQLLSLAQLMLNDSAAALAAAERAQSAAPASVASHIYASYAHQAVFDIPAAIAATEQALDIDPNDATAQINLARLQFGSGDLKKARRTAERAGGAAGNDPDLANLSGFIALSRGDGETAMAAFETAINAAPGMAEPYMGLGIAHMRAGDAAPALEAITTAAALEPARSLYLSYWGRMLYQVGRHEKALDVLERAASLDPRDPTPHHIRAVILRDLNRHGEAIAALNEAVKLNDNRAVYRSRFLLDQDLATRNVDLSLIFQQFGFNAWAQRKAVNAVNDDYTNYGGHLFFAGALSEQEGRDIAFANEALLARLLQPANINTFNNFNNYTSFFEQPGIHGTGTLRYGSFDQQDSEILVFGAKPDWNLAFQGGLFNVSTDGWRDVNREKFRSLAGIVKWDPTPEDSFFFSFSNTEVFQADELRPRFEIDSPANPRATADNDIVRVEAGYRHTFTPGTDLLIYVARLRSNGDLTDGGVTFPSAIFGPNLSIDQTTTTQFSRPFWQAQGQVMSRIGDHQLLAGTLNYIGENDIAEQDVFFSNFFGTITPLTNFNTFIDNQTDVAYHSLYLQDTWRVNRWLDVEGALYVDHFENSAPRFNLEFSDTYLNPRAGLVIQPDANTALRLAAFRYLSPFFTARTDATDVAGITIFRNSEEGALVDEYDIALEREWGSGYATVSAFIVNKRVDVFVAAGAGAAPVEARGRLQGVEFEFNQLVTRRIGIVGRYKYLDVEDDILPTSDRFENRAELEFRYIGPGGLSFGIAQGWRDLNLHNRARSEETAWYTDADISYLLPGRLGMLKLQARNLFDDSFNWVTDRFTLDGRVPDSQVIGTIEINF